MEVPSVSSRSSVDDDDALQGGPCADDAAQGVICGAATAQYHFFLLLLWVYRHFVNLMWFSCEKLEFQLLLVDPGFFCMKT